MGTASLAALRQRSCRSPATGLVAWKSHLMIVQVRFEQNEYVMGGKRAEDEYLLHRIIWTLDIVEE